MEESLNLILSRLQEDEEEIKIMALNMLIEQVKDDVTIVTPEILAQLALTFNNLEGVPKLKLADILSYISIGNDDIQTLTYRIKGGAIELKTFGIQYVKKLINLIIIYHREINANKMELFKDAKIEKKELEAINNECIDFLINHNSEIDCIDFLYEIREMKKIINKIDKHNYERIIQYLKGLSQFDEEIEYILIEIYKKMNKIIEEVISYIKIKNIKKVEEVLERVDFDYKCQIAFILSKLNINVETEDKIINFILDNKYNKKLIQFVNKDLEIDNTKKVDEFLKGLYKNREISTRQFQYISMANGLYHLGIGKDSLLYENKKLIEKNDKVESIGIFAALGFIDFYNQEKLYDEVSEFIFTDNSYRKSGALLALAISGCRTIDSNHTALALLTDSLTNDTYQKAAAMLGINLLYSGTMYFSERKEYKNKLLCNSNANESEEMNNNIKINESSEKDDVKRNANKIKIEEIKNTLGFTENNIEEIAMSLLTISSVYAGTGDISVSSKIISKLLEYSDENNNIFYKIMILALGILYINSRGEFKSDSSFNVLDFIENNAFDEYTSKFIYIILMGYSYAGSSNTFIIEEILSIISNNNNLRDIGYLMVALISIGDNNSIRMCMRLLGTEGENGRIAAIGLLYASNPLPEITEFLSKKINNNTLSVVFILGIVGCGTNNKNVIKILEDNYNFYQKNTKIFSCMRLSKGLINAGKGLYTINLYPYGVMDIKSVIHLSSLLFLSLEGENSIIYHKYFFMNYLIGGALTSKSITAIKSIKNINELEYVPVPISIGKPVDIVGMAGNPKKISSIQINNSPIVQQIGEMAELQENDTAYTNIIEGVVIMK